MCVTESVCLRGCEYTVCLCTCIRKREREAEGTCLGEGRDINHAKSNLAPWEFIRIQLKSMGSFMRQFSSRWLRGLLELSLSLGQHWLRAPPVLTPVHETMRIFHVSSSEMTHLQGLCEGGPPGLLVPRFSSSELPHLDSSQEVCMEERAQGVRGWCTLLCPDDMRD